MKVLDYDGTEHLIDKIYDAINSGGSADYIVEEGTSGIWTYRKWASGIAECWGEQTETKSPYVTLSGNWYGFFTSSVSLPFTFIEVPKVNASMKVANNLSATSPLNNITTTTVSCYGMGYGASGSSTLTVDYDVKGLWKEFTPSVSARAKVGYEDLTSQTVVNTSYFSATSGFTRRYGNLIFALYRLKSTTDISAGATHVPLVTLPVSVKSTVLDMLYWSNANQTRPLMGVENSNALTQSWTSVNVKKDDLWEFVYIGVIAD